MSDSTLPPPWADTNGMAAYLGLSTSAFLKLKRRWIAEGKLKEGRHFRKFSHRCVRYDIAQMHRLAHNLGRIIPSHPQRHEQAAFGRS